MSRTIRNAYPGHDYRPPWGKPGMGKFHKRAYNKAFRRIPRATGGKERTVARLASELKYKGT